MEIRLFGTQNDSIVDGPGIRYAVFVQGCNHNCRGCHNPGSHDPQGGYVSDTDTILENIRSNPLLDGVTFTGGEPFMQAAALADLAYKIKKSIKGLDIVVYTGYTIEEIFSGKDENKYWMDFMRYIDILVDGPFVEELRSLDLNFKGSENQRIIDVAKTFANGKIVLADI